MACQPHKETQIYIWLNFIQTCLLCDEPSDTPLAICVACEAELPWLGAHCLCCALPLPGSGSRATDCCGPCDQRPPAFTQVIAPWTYDFVVDRLITRFKHHKQWPLGKLLAELQGQYVQHRFDEGLPKPDALLPVPLSNQRLRQRGFNQSAMLTNWLGEELRLSVHERQLLRTRDTPSQQGLSAKARKQNLQGAFSLTDSRWVQGKHLALVDDVLTTGTTAQVMAQLLTDAGARRVDVYCLARTPSPED